MFVKKYLPSIFFSILFSISSSVALAFDSGYDSSPRGMVNIFGTNRYCRFVGDPPKIFLSCAREFNNDNDQYFFNSGPGIDRGYDNLPRGFRTFPNGQVGYCRFVDNPPRIREKCLMATQTGFDQEIETGRVDPNIFPIQKNQFTELHDHRHMETTARLSNNGLLDGSTRTWTDKALTGFTGAVAVKFLDINGNLIGISGVHSYGVDGRRVPGLPSDRTESWNEQVPKDLQERTAKMEIVHSTNAKELSAQLNRAVDITCGAVRKVFNTGSYCPQQN
jgi:hypothetical protein